ncbi:hypothetical protein DKP76_12380 [Falsochrobactrum shanghaiense]|uniref:Uncharacterized protein n=2 Tax=Falsochrobactrum shanghaiense TaxID=2201899 RepID=A0A316J8C2_9HYPH|nr:hypothetical protein DKP76_12380 [Falsochrobactrum shanghaiense]
MKKIQEFNASPHHDAAMRISADTIWQSVWARQRNAQLREDGALISSKELGRQLRLGLSERLN